MLAGAGGGRLGGRDWLTSDLRATAVAALGGFDVGAFAGGAEGLLEVTGRAGRGRTEGEGGTLAAMPLGAMERLVAGPGPPGAGG